MSHVDEESSDVDRDATHSMIALSLAIALVAGAVIGAGLTLVVVWMFVL